MDNLTYFFFSEPQKEAGLIKFNATPIVEAVV